jgi:transcriptional regulator with XRE-family HTH domain
LILRFKVGQRVKEKRMDLKAARKQRGWSQLDLQERTGVAAHNISALETGGRIMGKRLAGKFAEHLNIDSAELLIANRAAGMERAIKENNAPAALACPKAIVESVRDRGLTGEDEELLDRLLNATLGFAQKIEDSFASMKP